MQEIWKDVDGYVGFYKISNFGRLKSLYKKEEIIIIEAKPAEKKLIDFSY